MKKIFALLLVLVLTISAASLALAEEAKLIYAETFDRENTTDTAATLEALGWKALTAADGALTDNSATYLIEDGKLKMLNYNGGAINGNDSYALILDSDTMAAYCQGDFTLQYDLCYIDAASPSRYVVVITNYDGKDSYNSFHLRLRGNGNNEVRLWGDWFTLDDAVAEAKDENAIITKLCGKAYDGDAMGMKDVHVTIRYQYSKENGPIVFMRNNDKGGDFVEISRTTDMRMLGRSGAYAVALKTGGMVDCYIDNIVLWTGTGDMPAL